MLSMQASELCIIFLDFDFRARNFRYLDVQIRNQEKNVYYVEPKILLQVFLKIRHGLVILIYGFATRL